MTAWELLFIRVLGLLKLHPSQELGQASHSEGGYQVKTLLDH